LNQSKQCSSWLDLGSKSW